MERGERGVGDWVDEIRATAQLLGIQQLLAPLPPKQLHACERESGKNGRQRRLAGRKSAWQLLLAMEQSLIN